MRVNGNLELNALGQSEVQNLVVERVSSLPAFVSSEAGRVLYNATESMYYMNNGTQWITLATGGDAAALENEVDAIEAAVGLALNGGFVPWTGTNYLNTASTIKDGITALDVAVKSEEYARVNADNALQGAINTEAAARAQGDGQLQTSLNAEAAARSAGDTQLQNNIDAEAAARAADISAANAAILAERTRAQGAESGLASDIVAENARAVSAETGLQAAIDEEEARAIAAEDAINADLSGFHTQYNTFVAAQEVRDNAQDTQIGNRVRKAGDTMSGVLSMNGSKVTGLPAPTESTDAVNKEYVDQLVNGLKWKDPVRAANLIGAFVASPSVSAQYADTYIVGANATAVWETFNEGDVVQFIGQAGDDTSDANNWRLVESGPSVVGDRFVVAATSTSAPVGALTKNSIVTIGAGNTLAPTTPLDKESVFVFDEDNVNFGQAFMFLTEDGAHWVQFSGPNQVAAGIGLFYRGNTLHVGLGAGIFELPTDEVGIEVYPATGLMLTVDGTAESTDSQARLALKRDGNTLTATSNGLRVSQTILDSIANNGIAIQNEVTRATAAEDVLTSAVATETALRQAGDATLQTALDAEETARIAADAVQSANLTSEISARQAADIQLQSNIDDEASRAQNEESDIRSSVSSVIGQINNFLSKMYFLYESTAPSTTHTVVHNLDCRFVNVTVYFADTNEQILPQSVVTNNANQLTVTFNQSINARIVVMGLPAGQINDPFGV